MGARGSFGVGWGLCRSFGVGWGFRRSFGVGWQELWIERVYKCNGFS